MSGPDVGEAHKALLDAENAYRGAAARAAEASAVETDALNTLNRAQAAFDKAVEATRSEAPVRSDWKRQAGRPEAKRDAS